MKPVPLPLADAFDDWIHECGLRKSCEKGEERVEGHMDWEVMQWLSVEGVEDGDNDLYFCQHLGRTIS